MRINISTNPECYEYPLKLAVHTYLYAHVSVRISTLTYAYTSTCVYVHAHATVNYLEGCGADLGLPPPRDPDSGDVPSPVTLLVVNASFLIQA